MDSRFRGNDDKGKRGTRTGCRRPYPITLPQGGRRGFSSCQTEDPNAPSRLGFRQLKGFREEDAKALIAAREQGDFATMRAVWLRAGLSERALETLAKGDAWGIGRG